MPTRKLLMCRSTWLYIFWLHYSNQKKQCQERLFGERVFYLCQLVGDNDCKGSHNERVDQKRKQTASLRKPAFDISRDKFLDDIVPRKRCYKPESACRKRDQLIN